MEVTAVQFGSRTMIRSLRVFQVLFAAGFFLLFTDPRSLSFWAFAIGLVFFEAYFTCVVFAIVEEAGLTYQRWNKPVRVDWKDLHAPKQRWAWYITLELAGEPLWRRYLLLPSVWPSLHTLAQSSSAAKRLEELTLMNATGRTN